jgi:hypothetical protein
MGELAFNWLPPGPCFFDFYVLRLRTIDIATLNDTFMALL